MPTEKRLLKVFLCHASQDKPLVRELYQRLLAEDWIDPWLDKEELLPGQDWELEIEKTVDATDAVIVCLSKESVIKEGYFQKELRKVIDIANEKPEGVIFIIPLRLDECLVPRNIRKWHYLDYFPSDNREQSQKVLVQSLVKRAHDIGINERGQCCICDKSILSVHTLVKCLYCNMPYHKECWEQNIGCNKFGCEGNYKVEYFYQP